MWFGGRTQSRARQGNTGGNGPRRYGSMCSCFGSGNASVVRTADWNLHTQRKGANERWAPWVLQTGGRGYLTSGGNFLNSFVMALVRFFCCFSGFSFWSRVLLTTPLQT